MEDWDGEKARKASNTIDVLAKHYELVADALRRQAAALRTVTEMATKIINAIGPEKYTAEGAP